MTKTPEDKNTVRVWLRLDPVTHARVRELVDSREQPWGRTTYCGMLRHLVQVGLSALAEKAAGTPPAPGEERST